MYTAWSLLGFSPTDTPASTISNAYQLNVRIQGSGVVSSRYDSFLTRPGPVVS